MGIVVIYTSDDGLYIRELSEKEFTEELANGAYGAYHNVKWCSSIREFDKEHSFNGVILKGAKIVQPKAVETVTKYKLE